MRSLKEDAHYFFLLLIERVTPFLVILSLSVPSLLYLDYLFGLGAVIVELGSACLLGVTTWMIWDIVSVGLARFLVKIAGYRYPALSPRAYLDFKTIMRRTFTLVLFCLGLSVFILGLLSAVPTSKGIAGSGFFTIVLPLSTISVLLAVSWIWPTIWLIEDCGIRNCDTNSNTVTDLGRSLGQYLGIFGGLLVIVDVLEIGARVLSLPEFLMVPFLLLFPIALSPMILYHSYSYQKERQDLEGSLKRSGSQIVTGIELKGSFVFDKDRFENFLDTADNSAVEAYALAPLLTRMGFRFLWDPFEYRAREMGDLYPGIRRLMLHHSPFNPYFVYYVLIPKSGIGSSLKKNELLAEIRKVCVSGVNAPAPYGKVVVHCVIVVDPWETPDIADLIQEIRREGLEDKVVLISRESLISECQRVGVVVWSL